jgi:glutamate carboxypeptidase
VAIPDRREPATAVHQDKTDLLAALQARTSEMLGHLDRLVTTESPSNDRVALARCAEVVAAAARQLVGPADVIEVDGYRHVRWSQGRPRVLLLGHYDTVWPLGTTEAWPFTLEGDRASGPGVFDMKAGIVQGLYALAALDDRDGVELLITGDEEIGGKSSRALIEDAARRVDAVLVLEPSADGALKVVRKGGSLYRISVHGRAAHAGLEPEKGVNAVVELAHQILTIERLARTALGTSVTPSLVTGGTATNTVPARASVDVDVRAATQEEQERVDREIRTLAPVTRGARLVVEGGIDRPPLPSSASAELFRRARRIATDLGFADLAGAEVGGGSDGNFTAALGTPTLDGLGAVGGGAHAEGEWIAVDEMAPRAALVARLVDDLRG